MVEFPADLFGEDVPDGWTYQPVPRAESGPIRRPSAEVAKALVGAERPVIYAGQGVHYARGLARAAELAELLEAPVTTSLGGKSAFPETHPLSLGSGGRAIPKTVHQFLADADVIFGIGCSFTDDQLRRGHAEGQDDHPRHARPADINKDVPVRTRWSAMPR